MRWIHIQRVSVTKNYQFFVEIYSTAVLSNYQVRQSFGACYSEEIDKSTLISYKKQKIKHIENRSNDKKHVVKNIAS